jgi:hypothetical protein
LRAKARRTRVQGPAAQLERDTMIRAGLVGRVSEFHPAVEERATLGVPDPPQH